MEGVFGPFFVGNAARYADPFRVRRRLNAMLGGQSGADRVVKAWSSPEPRAALEAGELLMSAVREAFDLPAFDPKTGQGAGEEVLLQLWNEWQKWCGQKKTTAATSPTGTPPSPANVPPQASSPREPPWKTRQPPSASSSTPAASGVNGPGISPTANPSTTGQPR